MKKRKFMKSFLQRSYSEKSDKNDENNENDANNLYSHYQVLKRLIPLILMFAF